MESTIEILEEGDVVYASWHGVITPEKRRAFREAIQVKCEELGVKKFIVDLSYQINTTELTDNYDFGKLLRRKMVGYTIAAVYSNWGVNEEFLIETANRGSVSIRKFYDLESAKKWILSQ